MREFRSAGGRLCYLGSEVKSVMKTILIITGACLVAACVAGSVTLIRAFHLNRELRETNRHLEVALRNLQATSDALRTEKQTALNQAALAHDSTQSLQAKIADLEADNAREAEASTTPPVLKPYQVQAYLGQDLLGWVWVIPRNLRLDTNTQHYVYEPVVWLDEAFRNSFVVHHTNVVEREVEAPATYVNNSYYPQPVYFLASPGHHYRRPKQLPSQPPLSGGTQPAPVFNPGNGTTTPQQLGTPANSIITRPPVLGTPPVQPK